MQIIINVADDGLVTVEADGIEPSTYESAEEAVEVVQGLLGGGEMEEPDEPEEGEGAESPESDEQAMWDEEAARRPANPNLMN